jgi:hypothetical protein
MPDARNNASRDAVVGLARGRVSDTVEPLGECRRGCRLARDSQRERAERAQEEPGLEGAHRAAELIAPFPELAADQCRVDDR